MSGNAERLERASGPGHGDRLREPGLADGEALFGPREPLRPPRSAPPGGATTITTTTIIPGGTTTTTPAECSADSRNVSTVSYISSVSAAAVKPQAGPSAVYESTLSAHAPEFVPSYYTPVQEYVYEEDSSNGYYPEFSLADLVQDILSHLNSSPGSFETDIGDITSTLNDWVTSEDTLQELVELIFTQSTSMPNFTYTGARLCNFLSHHLALSPASGNFRQLLLKRCRTEFEQRQQALKGDDETQKRFHTYVLFLGELYLNLEVKSVKGTVSRAEILLVALKDLMDTLLSQPSDRSLMCTVKLLKLTGSVLEDAWKQSGKSHMDDLIQKIKSILLDAECSRDVRQMVLNLVELRSSNWGRVHAAAAYSEATPDTDPNYYMNEPTFYTADGTPFTAADPDYSEKYQDILEREDYFPDFYDENGNESEEDEMEPEIEEAFEKFCLETERKKP
ncbi:polyadenylate-binding protein-interacting protein 1 isoform X1 [Clarias gariepinus]|uniref:polyadenylate-binding protein-interacting protein 1 isoform X1 n=1 Tax=Clarias gariepinus TaxID=13013 RepID=UPI00234CDD4D|nr:polyadenylate-binding protein-interacting protein 1 isoform X1 [Clarias gariepinus]